MVEQRAVGLEGIVDGPTVGVLLLEPNDPLEEWNTEQGWLTALPGKTYMLRRLSVNVLTDIRLQHIIAHAVVLAALSIEILFFQVITICAVKITDRPVRLGHDMKWLHENRFLVLRRRTAPKTKPTSSTRGALYLNQDPIGIC